MTIIDSIKKIESDFEGRDGPFENVQFPEQRLLEELPHNSVEDRAIIASAFSTFDYNRNANSLVDSLVELYEIDDGYGTNHFDPHDIVSLDGDKLKSQFASVGFRYPSRDSRGWQVNNEILLDQYNGRWTNLIEHVDYDAPSLVKQLQNDGFLYLKGVKIAPMYARIIDNEVTPLDNIWELDIPVDTHVRRLSQQLFGAPEMTDDGVRRIWRRMGEEHEINRAIVDGALWHIGNKWGDWGEDYFEKIERLK